MYYQAPWIYKLRAALNDPTTKIAIENALEKLKTAQFTLGAALTYEVDIKLFEVVFLTFTDFFVFDAFACGFFLYCHHVRNMQRMLG